MDFPGLVQEIVGSHENRMKYRVSCSALELENKERFVAVLYSGGRHFDGLFQHLGLVLVDHDWLRYSEFSLSHSTLSFAWIDTHFLVAICRVFLFVCALSFDSHRWW